VKNNLPIGIVKIIIQTRLDSTHERSEPLADGRADKMKTVTLLNVF